MATYDEAYSNLMSSISEASIAMHYAIGRSSNTMSDYTDKAISYLEDSLAKGMATLEPYIQAGKGGIKQLNNLTGVNGQAAQYQTITNIIQPSLDAMQKYGRENVNQAMADFLNTVAPGYVSLITENNGDNPTTRLAFNQDSNLTNQITENPTVKSMMSYLMDLSNRSVQNSAASKGMLLSGRTMNQLQESAQGLASTNVMPLVNNLINNTVQGVAGIQQAGLNSTQQAGASLASSSISAVQNSLVNLVNQGNQAAQAKAQLYSQQGQTGSGYRMQQGQFLANNDLLEGKVHADALNAIAQVQFQADMGPYINSLQSPPGLNTGGYGNPTPAYQPAAGMTFTNGMLNFPGVPNGGYMTNSGFTKNSLGQFVGLPASLGGDGTIQTPS